MARKCEVRVFVPFAIGEFRRVVLPAHFFTDPVTEDGFDVIEQRGLNFIDKEGGRCVQGK